MPDRRSPPLLDAIAWHHPEARYLAAPAAVAPADLDPRAGARPRLTGRSMTSRSGVGGLGGVLWDMDGTLIDSEKLWDVALHEAVERLGGSLTEDQRASLIGSNMDNTSRYLLAITGHDASREAVAEVGGWIRDRTAELFADELPWRPGAREALAAVRAAGVPSALVTSTERGLTELALGTIGRSFFEVTVCGDEVDGLNKPHPEPYLRAARLLGVDPECCVAVEDSPPGTESAVAAGCTVLVVPNDAPVASGERRVLRSSLLGVDAPALAMLLPSR
jgi:HAD superfamily hydrolase (TIGR01509 family)